MLHLSPTFPKPVGCGKSLIVQQRTSQGDMTDLLDSNNIDMHFCTE